MKLISKPYEVKSDGKLYLVGKVEHMGNEHIVIVSEDLHNYRAISIRSPDDQSSMKEMLNNSYEYTVAKVTEAEISWMRWICEFATVPDINEHNFWTEFR